MSIVVDLIEKRFFHFSDKTGGKENILLDKNFYDSLTVHREMFLRSVYQIAVIDIP